MSAWLLIAVLSVGGQVHRLEEVYETQAECEERGEQIYQSHVDYYEDKPKVPALVVECWLVERDSV